MVQASGETVNLLNEWMDPRHHPDHGMGEPSDEEMERPMMWRFWRALPPKGKIGVFLGSWYTWPIVKRVMGLTKLAELDQSLERANRLEKMLTDEGALIIKFWLHLSKEMQENTPQTIGEESQDTLACDQAGLGALQALRQIPTVNESVIRHTSTAEAPWIVIEGADPHYRSLTVGKVILEAIRKRLAESDKKKEANVRAAPLLPSIDKLTYLDNARSHAKAGKEEIRKRTGKISGQTGLAHARSTIQGHHCGGGIRR